MPKTQLFMVEHCCGIGGQWEDAEWTDGNEKPLRFTHRITAEAEIHDHVRMCKDAVKAGNMEDAYELSDFRVVPAP